MSRLDHVSRVAGELERGILSGELAPGSRLPSERDISIRMGVSRSVVREALRRLASLGLVRSVHGSGTRVEAPNSHLVTAGYQQLLQRNNIPLDRLAEVRLPLESAIVTLAALRRDDTHLARMKAAQQVLADARQPLEKHVQADLEFHAALADATGNPLFGLLLAPIQQLLIESRRRTLGTHGAALAHRHHRAILQAVEAGDAEAATQAMRTHIEVNWQHLHQAERLS